MSQSNYRFNNREVMSCLKMRWHRNVACLYLIAFFVLFTAQNAFAQDAENIDVPDSVVESIEDEGVTHPDTVPGWYPAELCMEMMNILVDEYGLSSEGAASVLGNVCQESKYDANANSGYYIGICQWDPHDRWPLISDWIIRNGYSTDNAIAQLRAVFEDAENGRYSETIEYMATVSSIEDGVHRWLVYYEGAPGQEEAERVSYAYDALEVYNANA